MTEKEKVQLAPCAPAGWMDSLLGAEQRVNSYLSSFIHSSWLSFKILGVIQGKTSARKAGDVPSGGSGLTAGINSFTFRTSPTAAAVSEPAGASGIIKMMIPLRIIKTCARLDFPASPCSFLLFSLHVVLGQEEQAGAGGEGARGGSRRLVAAKPFGRRRCSAGRAEGQEQHLGCCRESQAALGLLPAEQGALKPPAKGKRGTASLACPGARGCCLGFLPSG